MSKQKKFIPAIIGCGGVTSYLLTPLLLTFKPNFIYFFDGDHFEEHNFSRMDSLRLGVGENKAATFQKLAECLVEENPNHDNENFFPSSFPEYFNRGSVTQMQPQPTVLISCADNHEARSIVLEAADLKEIPAIIAGNDLFDSSAMLYLPQWKNDKERDPRILFPEILTDKTNSPLSCQDEELLNDTPQLAIANFGAAYLVLYHLWRLLHLEEKSLTSSNYIIEANEYNINSYPF